MIGSCPLINHLIMFLGQAKPHLIHRENIKDLRSLFPVDCIIWYDRNVVRQDSALARVRMQVSCGCGYVSGGMQSRHAS